MTSHPEETRNLVQLFLDRVERYQNRDALLRKVRGTYQPISWLEWAKQVKQIALGLRALGVQPGDRVGLLSENRPEWTFADLGSLSLGAVVVPLYPTSSCQDVAYILKNAGIQVLFLSTGEQREKITEIKDLIPDLKHIVLFDQCEKSFPNTIHLKALLEMGRLEALNQAGLYEDCVSRVRPADLATIIYTSGTTGPPKGVMLSHLNFVANYIGASERIPVTDKDIALSFLPLSHIFERLAGYYYMVFHGATIAYAENMQTVPEDMALIRPTVAAAVPRFYEKLYARVLERAEAASPLTRRIFAWALLVGRKRVRLLMQKKPIPLSLTLAFTIAQTLVFKKLQKRLGGRLRFFISGGAPLAKELGEFFFSADILILEGYGLTETSPVITVNTPACFRFGTVGHPLANAEVKIAQDGEILTRGVCVMQGYYQNEKASEEAMEGGWFHTGDIGTFDTDGFLKITDRKKDIIVTSGGKNISPQNIEGLVLGDKLFSQIVVLGDKRNYLVALIVLNRPEVERYAQEKGIEFKRWEDLLARSEIEPWVESRLRERTRDLALYEQIKYFALLPRELTQESEELTPTLKIKRKVVIEKFRDVIERLYQKGAQYAKV